jgi:NTP pyrophosphatase (non-canonical NTP hydrolase)
LTGGTSQQLVRATIAGVGGYWRPLAAVARLLEELGELAELLAGPAHDRREPPSELASELADLWIITTAIADQFLGDVAEPGSRARAAAGPGDAVRSDLADGDSMGGDPAQGDPFRGLVATAGQIARIVNYYDGPKTPRSLAGWPSLSDTVAQLHARLATVADAHGVDLAAAVAEKLGAIPVRDSERFAQSEHDPSTAPCLERFRKIRTTPWGADVDRARLWGGPAWSSRPLAANVAAIVPTLVSFTRAALPEGLDGYVIEGPVAASDPAAAGGPMLDSASPDDWAREVLCELARLGPQGDATTEPTAAFNGLRLSPTALSYSRPYLLLRPRSTERPG